MGEDKKIRLVLSGKPTIEGAGVHLKRGFGFNEVPIFDPFLLLDDFHSDNPEHYLKGFPWHPHRGIETITYVLNGEIEHGDSMGNKGVIRSGDVQWMTAGSGIVHQEMPKGYGKGLLWGFQLWANLPASQKMMAPRYRDIKSEQIPLVTLENGVKIKIICGDVEGQRGPVRDVIVDPEYLDISMPPHSTYVHPVKEGHRVFSYVIDGKGCLGGTKSSDNERQTSSIPEMVILFGDGDQVLASTGEESLRFLLVSGRPLGEPVAWHGPIVMNTQEELETAFEEYRTGRFIKDKK